MEIRRTHVRPNLYLLLICLLLPVFACAQSTETASWETQIDSLFSFVDPQSPGYMIAVIDGSEVVFESGYGMADLENLIPIGMQTSFNIASLSKQFTAAAIALLILDGKLNLEDDVKPFFPESNFSAGQMRLKHLVYMTSGINDYYYNSRPNGTDWGSLNFFNIDDALAASFSSTLMYEPGSQWSYSNINYMMMTKIVEQVSGQSFASFVKERLFDPIGMEHSLVNDDIFQVIPRRANGYNHRDAENTENLIENGYLPEQGSGYLQIHRNSPHYGGSGIFTSMEDYAKWMINYHSKEVWGDAFYELMHHTMKFDHDKSNDAFGLVHGEHFDKATVWYEGGDWGFSSFFKRFVEEEVSIVCFSNLGTGHCAKYSDQLADILMENGILD